MRKNDFKRLLILITIYLILAGCAASRTTMVRPAAPPLSVNQLLEQFPAQDETQQTLLLQALIAQPPDSLQKVFKLFASGDSIIQLKTQYALHGLFLNFARFSPAQKQKLLTITAGTLNQLKSAPKKQFLIEQIQWTADDRFAPVVQPFFSTERLRQSVLRTLKQLEGPQTDRTVLNLLKNSPEQFKPALIALCAQKRIKKSVPLLRTFLSSENEQVRQAALLALARLADLSILDRARQHAFLSFELIRALIDQHQPGQAQSLIAYWLTNAQRLSCSQFNQLLELTYALDQKAALEQAFSKFKNSNNPSCRNGILFTVEHWDARPVAGKFSSVFNTTDHQAQLKVIDFFARTKNRFAFAPMLSFWRKGQPAKNVRRALIRALVQQADTTVIPPLIQELTNHPENTPVVLQALSHFNTAAYSAPLISAFKQMPDSTKPAVIRFAARHHLTNFQPLLLRLSQTADVTLRQVSWQALAELSVEEQLDSLFALALTIQEPATRDMALKSIGKMVKREKLQRQLLALVNDRWPGLDTSAKIDVLHLCRVMGGKSFFKLLQSALTDQNPDLKKAARRELMRWPDDAALPTLLQMTKTEANQKEKILALRQALYIIKKSQMAAERAFLYLSQLLQQNWQPAEKQMIVAALGDFPDFESIKLLSRLTADQDVGPTAFTALTRLLQERTLNEDENLKQAYLAIIAGHASARVAAQIEEMRSLNKPPQGFQALFNGKNLDGWQAVAFNPVQRKTLPKNKLDSLQQAADQEMRQHWRVHNGILMFDGHGYLSLQTKRFFRNFELLIDWKIEKFGDSGIYLRGVPQVQIWDPNQWHIGSGGLYNNRENASQPLTLADNPIGQWNHFRIIMKGNRVTVYLNGKLVVNNVPLENYWERGQPLYDEGPIELQAHNSPLYFKNIFIRQLPDEGQPFKGRLFNGKNLDGWQVIGNTKDSWGVKDSILFTTGQGGGWLSTTRQFSDFKLSLEFKVPPGGNSGVFIRAPHYGDPAYTGIEIQVLDDYASVYARLKPWQYTGSLYAVQAPAKRVTKRAGQWQKMVITCCGPEIQVELNGSLINKVNVIDYMHLEKTHPGLKNRKGFIGLQNHTSVVEYRNIYLEELKCNDFNRKKR